MSKSHHYIANASHSFAISPLLTSHVLEFCNDNPFERATELLNSALPAAQIGSSQSQRLMQYYGDIAETEELLTSPGFDTARSKSARDSASVLYVQADGGHLFTDDGYKEVKVGRIFAAHHVEKTSSDRQGVELRNKLSASDYLVQLGSHKEFTARFNKLVDAHIKQNADLKIVAISDGAEWIGKWLKQTYPSASVILDFYHASEHLAEFATLVFDSKTKRTEWIDARKKALLEGKIDEVIEHISLAAAGKQGHIVSKSEELKNYYGKNRYRMKYNEYLLAGYCIGSGAIESAISTVVQQRCKLVGQRWTKRVTAVLNIRAVFKSGKKEKLRNIINAKMGYKNAA